MTALGLNDYQADCIEVFVQVPGSGDWSNEQLVIGVDAPLSVVITTVEEETTSGDPRAPWLGGGDK